MRGFFLAVAVMGSLTAQQSYSEYMIRQAGARDLVFVQTPSNPACPMFPVNIACANQVHFNGDWKGVKLCRATKCVAYEAIFP